MANEWMEALNIDRRFPPVHAEFLEECHHKGQLKPTPLILKYGKGGFNTLHQDLYGEVYFPFQLVLFLDEYGKDYSGGEFVMTEQVPRAQSKAIVLKPGKGDMLVFTTNFRPVKGSRGYYRAAMKHGVSEVLSGERHTLGIIFHDALS
ncbi:2OG-Fe(II) oxygenase [Anseongella ginsenosidimutans]|nr:2OG-Fe(II) oxygenase [Anseongella ginsenosidimutans]